MAAARRYERAKATTRRKVNEEMRKELTGIDKMNRMERERKQLALFIFSFHPVHPVYPCLNPSYLSERFDFLGRSKFVRGL